jgi:tetratricopeptide (TPR) repeat protein
MEDKANFMKGLNKALESAVAKSHLFIEQLPVGASKFRSEIHSILSENNRSKAFDILFSVTDSVAKRDYIDGVLCAGRFLLSNKLIEECYIFLIICQEKVEEVYGEPVDYILFEEIGNMFYFAGLCNEAIRWYEKLMEINEAPESKMYFSIGMCYQVMENYEKAIESYIKSTYADPKYSKSWVNLGYCYIRTEKPSKAIQAFQQLSLSAESLLCLGNAHYYDGNYEEAIAFYLRSIEFKEDEGTYNNLGIALKKVGLLQDAIYAFSDSLSVKPNTEAATNLIVLYIELGKKSDVQQLFKTCGHLIPPTDSKALTKVYEERFPNRRVSVIPGINNNLLSKLINKNTTSGAASRFSVSPEIKKNRLSPR